MTRLSSEIRMLIAVRVVVVTSLLLTALIIQFTVNLVLPINYIYLLTGVTYAMTLGYIVFGKVVRSSSANLYVQLTGDLLIETALVYFTGGLDSPFSFLYLVSIITAAMLLFRRGGIIVASLAVILYGTLGDLMYYGVIPFPELSFYAPTPWSSGRLYLNMATNFAGFYATALLTSFISEKLRKTFHELDVNRQSLAELRALNQNVVESIPSGLITLTPGGVVTFLNPAGSEILGIDSRAAFARHLSHLGLFSVEEWEELRDLIVTSRIVRGEKNDFRRGDETISIGYAITTLNTLDGNPAGLTLIFQDLTEMKKLEAQLRLKDRMAAVGELSAGIAHEIRNPLAAIAGSVQVLKKSESLTDQEQRLMSIILKESDRLNQSIADFLRFVKPQEKNVSTFDIAANLSETLELLSNSRELKAHQIRRSIDPPSFVVTGDSNQIRQVFWNIAKNAIQAMPDGGTLTVGTSFDDTFYRIVFADTGRGMSESDQRRLFQPFRTNFPSGTGLGMAISFRIVQEHGGKIDVDSKEGSGTTIIVSIPRDAQAAIRAAREAIPLVDARRELGRSAT